MRSPTCDGATEVAGSPGANERGRAPDTVRVKEAMVAVLRIVDELRLRVLEVTKILADAPDGEVADACRRLAIAINDLDDRVWVASQGLASEGRW